MAEVTYKNIIDKFLRNEYDAVVFVDLFSKQWKKDRDDTTAYDPRFQRLIDRLFTTCDCYSENPETSFDISETQLRDEVSLLDHIWFG
jgi:Bacterial self-protective colicin-like immunity